MKRHIIYDVTNGNIHSVLEWGDNRDLPNDYPIPSGHEALTIDNDSVVVDGIDYSYNVSSGEFLKKLKVSVDNFQISHVDGVATITVQYPSPITETCIMTLDGQSVDLSVVDGLLTIPFSCEILGWKLLNFESTSVYGKTAVSIEVI